MKTDQGQDFELKFHDNNVHTFKFYFAFSIKDKTQDFAHASEMLSLRYTSSIMKLYL